MQVSHDEPAQKGNSDAGLDGIAGALARALQERSKAIHSSGLITFTFLKNQTLLYLCTCFYQMDCERFKCNNSFIHYCDLRIHLLFR